MLLPLSLFLLLAGYALNAQAELDSCCNANNLQNITAPKKESDRSVFQLGHMIRCQSGCDPLSYKRYGCFCGFKGAGRPVDSIDRCCLNHDWCYTRLGCPPFALYVLRYRWLCRKPGHAQCLRNQYANVAMNYCALRLCECDRTFANCVARSACPQRKAICWTNPLIAFTNLIASL